MSWRIVGGVLCAVLALPVAAGAAEGSEPAREVEQAREDRRQLLELVRAQQERIDALERRLATLEAAEGTASAERPAPDETLLAGERGGEPGAANGSHAGTESHPSNGSNGSKPSQGSPFVARYAEERLASAQAPPPPQTVTVTAEPREGETVTWTEIAARDSKLQLYGFVRLDFQRDDTRTNNTQTIGFVLSEDPAAPDAIRAPEDSDSLAIHPRMTRLGLRYDGPRIGLGGPELSGRVEVDFYNSGLLGQSESREAIRMRHGYMELDWDRWELLAGQTSDLISPLFPQVNNDLVMWGAGNLGDRRPQLRATYSGGDRFVAAAAIGLTGAIDNVDLDGNRFLDGETSGKPTLQGRVAYAFPAAGRRGTIGLWGHRSWQEPDVPIAGEDEFTSEAFGLDLELPLLEDRLWLKAELWTGSNLTDVRGGIFQGINLETGEEIDAQGGWVELGLRTAEFSNTYFGFTTDDPDDDDLLPTGRSKNEVWYLANRFTWGDFGLGLEYLHWTTEYREFDEGTDNRFVTYFLYQF